MICIAYAWGPIHPLTSTADVDFLAFDGLSIDETPQERRRRLESDMFYDAESGSEDDMVERITGATTKLEPRGEVNSLLVDRCA